MQRLRELLALVLIAALPFHALGVTVLTRIVAGPNQSPLGVVALWKEALLGVILLSAFFEIARSKKLPRVDRLDGAIALLAIALFGASFLNGTPLSQMVYGIRYDLVPFGAFLILRRVGWSAWFLRRLPIVLVSVAIIVAAYALLTLLLPNSFFSLLGYSDLHSLYIPGRPIAAFQQIGGTLMHRLQGTMSGPNQFGIYLAMVLPFALTLAAKHRRIVAPLLLLGILLSLSRAAWIASAVILLVHFWPTIRSFSVRTVTVACIGVLVLAIAVLYAFPTVLLRVESSLDHLRNPVEAASIMIKEPLGQGLSAAGPASNRISDACVFVEAGADTSWAAPHQDLCVFVGDVQVQPVGRACTCPLLPENWYLQLGVEGGALAFVVFAALIIFALRRLWIAHRPTFLALLAVCIAGLFLHAFEDAAVAYTVWMLAAVALVRKV